MKANHLHSGLKPATEFSKPHETVDMREQRNHKEAKKVGLQKKN